MDEIVIEDKKYISTKRAAKVTGYAKDYIGQLCREGRVPAQLVGRSWYVLESALKDHRFGNKKEEEQSEQDVPQELFSRYEADTLESIEMVAVPEAPVREEKGEKSTSPVPEEVQTAWEAWFDRVEESSISSPENQDRESLTETVAIHTLEDLPIAPPESQKKTPQESRQKRSKSTGGVWRVFLFSIALCFLILSSLNSGYFDEYIISDKQDSFILGITVYIK